jgi:hypothetical protein
VGLVASLIADTGSNRRLTAAAISFAALLVALGTGVLGMHHAMNRRRTLEDHAVDVLAEKIRTAMSEAHATRPLFSHRAADLDDCGRGAAADSKERRRVRH